jgi:antitoxin VapB
MGMQLNIKSDDAYALASELATLTGESLTAAVTEAIRQRLEREKAARGREERLRRIRALTAQIREHLGQPLPASDHSWLYDDDGLPV